MESLRFVVDVGVGKKVELYLRGKGYALKSIREIDYKMKDSDILKIAHTEKAIIMTMDKDFGELVHHSGMEHSGVLLLSLEDADGKEKVRILEEIISKHKEDLKNNFCVYQNSIFRVKSKYGN